MIVGQFLTDLTWEAPLTFKQWDYFLLPAPGAAPLSGQLTCCWLSLPTSWSCSILSPTFTCSWCRSQAVAASSSFCSLLSFSLGTRSSLSSTAAATKEHQTEGQVGRLNRGCGFRGSWATRTFWQKVQNVRYLPSTSCFWNAHHTHLGYWTRSKYQTLF